MSDTKAQIIDLCRRRVNQGMPPSVFEATARLLWPSIRLILDAKQETSLGRSRIGGLPDLPEGVDWAVCQSLPELSSGEVPIAWDVFLGQPLSFLLQINLTEVAPFDLERRLPESGMLYFFYIDVVDRFTLSPTPVEIIQVLYAPGKQKALRRVSPPANLPPKEVYHGFTLSPRLEWVIPEPYDLWKEGIEQEEIKGNLDHWSDLIDRPSLQEEAAQVQGFGPWYEPKHRLLGHPQLIQSLCTANNYPGARLLLQVDSDWSYKDVEYPQTGMMWGDAGRIYYYIREDDLVARNFGAVWAHLEMS